MRDSGYWATLRKLLTLNGPLAVGILVCMMRKKLFPTVTADVPLPHVHVTLLRRYSANGATRFCVLVDGDRYDVSERQYALLQWGESPAKLHLRKL